MKLEEGSSRDTRKRVSQETLEQRLIIELNAQPSFIIFSYLFTPRLFLALWSQAMEINWKDFIIQFYFTILFCFFSFLVFPSRFLLGISRTVSWFSSNLEPFCSGYVCFCSRFVFFSILLTEKYTWGDFQILRRITRLSIPVILKWCLLYFHSSSKLLYFRQRTPNFFIIIIWR